MTENVSNEIVGKETPSTNCTKIRLGTPKEDFEFLLERVLNVRHELMSAKTEDSAKHALHALDELASWIGKAEVKGLLKDIQGMVRSVLLHDATRSQLDELLEQLITKVRELIHEETKKENSRKLRALLIELAEHTDEIAGTIDMSRFFG